MSSTFKFPLETLRKHRAHKLSLAKKEFMTVENKIVELMRQLQEMKEIQRSLFSQDGIRNPQILPFTGQAVLLDMQRKRISQVEISIKDQELELEKHRRWLSELNRDMRALEKLEEKMHRRWEIANKKQEQKQNDSWVVVQWSRQEKEGGEA